MKFRDLLQLILRGWKLNKTRTRLVIGAIALIVGLVALLVALGFGLGDLTLGRLATHGALTAIDVSSPDPNETPLSTDSIARIKALKKVKAVNASVDVAGTVTIGKVSGDAAVMAADRGYFASEASLMLGGNNNFKSETAKEAVISSALMSKLNLKSPREIIGQEVILNVYVPDYAKLGTYRVAMPEASRLKIAKKVTVIGVSSEDQFSTVQIPLGLLGIKDPYYSNLKVDVAQQGDVAEVKRLLEDSGFSTLTYGDKFSDVKTVLFVSRIAFAVIGLLILLIASIIAANTMTISLLEQAKQVATLKKLGMSDDVVRRLYMTEALSLVALGSLIGAVGAFLLGWVLNLVFYLIAKATGRNGAALFALPLYFVPLALISGAIVGLIAGLFPSKRAMRLSITKEYNGTER